MRCGDERQSDELGAWRRARSSACVRSRAIGSDRARQPRQQGHEVWVGIDTIVAESGWKHEAVERALRWLAHHGLLANVGYRDRSRLRQAAR